jgi:hypothetical protein
LVATALLVALSGCSSETGILIEVTMPEELRDVNADGLSFYIEAIGPQDDTRRLADQMPVDFSTGRNLFADPYRLMLRRGDIGENTVMVAAVGFVDADPGARLGGALVGPVAFAQGQVHKWTITLEWLVADPSGCVTINGANGNITVGPRDDFDCDGQTAADGDCDDGDDNTYTGAVEICDGRPNTCNPDIGCDEGHDIDRDGVSTCGSIIDNASMCTSIDDTMPDCADDPDLEPLAKDMYPGNPEICNGIDNDCSGCPDDPPDTDGDGYDICGSATVCGGSPWFQDCAENDPAISPGWLEFCDGADTNCDGRGIGKETCFTKISANECLDGHIQCNDSTTDVPFDPAGCQQYPGSESVPIEFCDGYDTCSVPGGGPDRLGCTYGTVTTQQVFCEMYWRDDGTGDLVQCPSGAPQLYPDTQGCTWRVVGGAGSHATYVIGLINPAGVGDPLDKVSVCNPILNVETDSVARKERVLLQKFLEGGGPDQFYEVYIEPVVVDTCPQLGFDCLPDFQPFGG